MKFEQYINTFLNKFPGIKKVIKRVYQLSMYAISPKIKSEGNIVRVTPDDDYEYFFGYYDKSPWDSTERYMLCLRAKCTWKDVAPKDKADIILIDTKNNNEIKKIAETSTWNVQQGCMLQWLGPSFDKEIIYNDFRNGKYCSIILNVFTNKERVIDFPVYSVSSDGKFALSLDFSRLHRLRPGYGYSNIEEKTKAEKLPNSCCIWYVDLIKNKSKELLNYTDFYNFETRDEMIGSEHKINHIMLCPNNKRFMVIHRWFKGTKKYSRLITCDVNGKEMYNLSDDDMVSHCFWKNDKEILAFLRKKESGNGYYLMKDKTKDYIHCFKEICNDGHPSFSPNGKYIVTDSYPNRSRIQEIKLLDANVSLNKSRVIAKVFSPFRYDNDVRCDLHPRWNRKSDKVCFDSVFEGKRNLYIINLKEDNENNVKLNSKKKRIVYLMTSCKKCGPTQQTLNIIKNIDLSKFEVFYVTIYNEEKNSMLKEYLPYVKEHYFGNASKKDIFLGRTKKLDSILDMISPDVIHTVGLFPNFYVSKKRRYKQITTIRNYFYDDYPAKYGKVIGFIMSKLNIWAVNRTDKVFTCSLSLANIYNEHLNYKFDYIQNGVDIRKYNPVRNKAKKELRSKLNLSIDSQIYVYSGQFIERKNIDFLLECFSSLFTMEDKKYLILLGDGCLFSSLHEKYSNYNNIQFVGNVLNVSDYLNASDIYVSCSKSEGLPNGVLEAMAAGLPVLLSDIPQHSELFMYENDIGSLYNQSDKNDFKNKLLELSKSNLSNKSNNARDVVEKHFSDVIMSKKYQSQYELLMKGKDDE